MKTKPELKQTDRDLVKRILGGSHDAFGVLVKNTEGLVAQLVFNMIPSPADRKDIAQEVYLKAYINLKDFKFKSKLSTWIGQITYHTCLHYLEKKRPFLLENLAHSDIEEDSLELLMQKQHRHVNQTETKLFESELQMILKTGISLLSPQYQTLIALYHQEELSMKEIGEITSLPEGTVKNYLFRARKQLKTYLLAKYKREEL
ncbi:RNA polymerase sigma-70 factor (ECF subfamily) [Anseongella ginsenosidimutans]|uniref:RNA polymerase sigma-70 factor (ECF subfamily) n=1 Tax=Anseongella ginsenosidimutans TaxID=496056 RepID=A0A4R3KWN9_9SPHI|nr:sigma-70 family RNA polymerase sigma factor [Anseongella ginsenosidimutans]QEC53450.1 sigma-70 family RNA polymerase sigma factor [Anseongella ginsenosidimutans]TCS88341.1 RNA polymerase sigma-70 factor (ECF subfamily) [Anseongella ginsenosidimutans]